jgi:hypothetical protein
MVEADISAQEPLSKKSLIRLWWRQPGELADKKGIPIYPGDLLRYFHFTGACRKKYFLYHVAVFVNGDMELVPISHLQAEQVRGGGRCMLSQDLASECEVISGHGPKPDFLSYDERVKVAIPKNGAHDLPRAIRLRILGDTPRL